jgi:hypothetical protein
MGFFAQIIKVDIIDQSANAGVQLVPWLRLVGSSADLTIWERISNIRVSEIVELLIRCDPYFATDSF